MQKEVRTRPKAQAYSRIMGGEVSFKDALKLMERCDQNHEDWVDVAVELGDYDMEVAKTELAKGHLLTARRFFWDAANVYRVGQYGLADLTEEKSRIYGKILECTARTGELSNPAWEKVEIPFRDFKMDGWFILPEHMPEKCPIVLVIPGATGFKEEFIAKAKFMTERGLAALVMDGPGQGSTLYFNKGYLTLDVEKAYSAMVDFIEADGRFGKIGIFGASTGGYYVARAVGTDSRFAACAINGGTYDPMEILDFNPVYRHRFATLYGVSDEEMNDIFPHMTLDDVAKNITCPILLTNGDKDTIFKPEGIRKLYDAVSSEDKTIRFFPGGWHCAIGFENEVNCYYSDWLADRLKG